MSNTNLFDIHEHFFIIDSNRLSDVTTKLYGYTIIDDIIVEQASAIGNAHPSAEGAFVYVCADEPETIMITQDFIGSFGLYLYREDEYFALSNSFAYLTDYLKKSRKLTLNRDYINHFIISGLSPTSYSETPINEIEYLDRSAVVSIHVPTRALSISLVDYQKTLCPPLPRKVWRFWTDGTTNGPDVCETWSAVTSPFSSTCPAGSTAESPSPLR